MKFNTRVRYGLRAMLEIALADSENGVFQKDISERQKISVKYLDTIIASLKTAGLIMNKKGKKSGYKLTKDPGKIKIIDVYRAFEPAIEVVDCVNKQYECDLESTCGVKDFWCGLNDVIINHMKSCSIEDLVRDKKMKSIISN